MMTKEECVRFCSQFSDYIDGEIGEQECSLIEEHLEGCGPCSAILDSLKATVTACHGAVRDEIPESVRLELKAFLRKHCTRD
jgi:anti-sigma factor RsiW